ncbi:S10 family peptidase [Nocardioides sp. GXQ0305]|uniref:S10 family peptidase n=1 Tax=Nocardioides sp. GXQ0305 TaxID=3423912 RepID=UPI003D7C65FD
MDDQPDAGRPAPTPDTKPEPIDQLVETHHSLVGPGHDLAYTARTGRVVLREEAYEDDVFTGWKPRAEMAVTAYTLNDADVAERPVCFVFNGGPGSASVWLHLGLLGPRRVDMGDVGDLAPPPYGLVDNAETLLHEADLVFIDPMSTGHTRAVEGGKAKEFHGFGKDVEQVAELVRLWCTREDRWMSPKYLIGESYGTVRAVAVAERLWSTHMMAFNGLVLVSSVLDFGSQDFSYHRSDEACQNFLPTYAAIAHYHGRHEGRTLEEVVAEAEAFAGDRYRWALGRGSRLDPEERQEVVATVARLAGLSEDYVDRADLRVEHVRFCTELLRDRGLALGRIDGRFTGPLHFGNAEKWDADPSMDAIVGPYAAAIHHYLRSELRSDLDLPYEVFANQVKKWSYQEFEGRPINVSDKLERLMRANPHLRVRVEYGYYDLATPFAAAADTVAHLRLTPEQRARVEHDWFETGHMPYLHEESRVREAAGIAAFVRG